jgi:diaminohydroxyphosphoribosylaminopyrimidine deaminase/5-amino-6-(5-phosphoribosylamino)uracil reductase
MRQQYSAIMAGVDTIIYDDPLLNIRLKGEWKNPLKIIADTRARISPDAKVMTNDPQLTIVAVTELAETKKLKQLERTGAQVLVCPQKGGRVDLGYLMKALGAMGVDSVMLEGGSTLAFSAIREKIVDKVVTFIAPKLLGGAKAPTAVGGKGIRKMEDAVTLRDLRIKKIGGDLMVVGYVE